MKARRLPSGNYRCETLDYIDEKGKHHNKSFTAPTRKEAEFLAAQYKLTRSGRDDSTLSVYVERYIESRKNTVSPSTVMGYKKIQRCYIDPYQISKVKVSALTNEKVQLWIDDMCADGLSSHTVSNAYHLFSAVLGVYLPRLLIKITLPQRGKNKVVVPKYDDVQKLIRYLYDNDYQLYIAVILSATDTLRRGEICALEQSDINRKSRVISVTKSMVLNTDHEWVIKKPKTYESYRTIKTPQWVMDDIPKVGKPVDMNPNMITNRFCRVIKKLGLNFRFHDLRHFSASIPLMRSAVSLQTMKERGGWGSLGIMESNYLGSNEDEETREEKELMSVFTELNPVKKIPC